MDRFQIVCQFIKSGLTCFNSTVIAQLVLLSTAYAFKLKRCKICLNSFIVDKTSGRGQDNVVTCLD